MDNRRRMLLSGGLSADPVLENNDWATISKVARAGKAAEFWNIGDLKNITVDGVTYAAQIIGFGHDDVSNPAAYGRAKAGITFQLQNSLNTMYPMNNTQSNEGGWKNSLMRTSTLVTLKKTLPLELQNVITNIIKFSGLGCSSSGVESTNDDLFLLSEIEVFGKNSRSVSGEGSQYAYYKAGKSKIKKINGAARTWWERSPYSYNSNKTSFCDVTTSGTSTNCYANYSIGVAFAFCV